MKTRFVTFLLLCIGLPAAAQKQSPVTPGNGNPIIPGYFADPTIKKFGDTYYIYATTDGNGGGLGPSQVWTSKDLVNWTFQDMNWPSTYHYWAPDVTLGNDGKYYMYYCQPVEIFGASSTSPIGPWTSLLPNNKAMIPNYFVPGVITLDGQTFRDDDGKFYMYWGTWGIYPDHGCGVGLMNADMTTFAKTGKIPNTIAKDFFEAPFMFKRKGIYYLTYSSGACEDETYRVQYVMSKTGPMEGFTYGKNSPILVTNEDKTVHGPGHQSVIQVGEEYYLVYHRHNNPNSGGGFHRQICIDKIVFDEEGNIEKLVPTHTGIGAIGKNTNPYPDQAFGKKIIASSFYNEDYKPSFAVDNNNGTLWKPATNSTAQASLQIDLGKLTSVKTIRAEFEYAAWYYQYKLEHSTDGKTWKMYADRTTNKVHGSPMVDDGDVKTRYIKLTITGTEKPGMFKALWNIKVYSNRTWLSAQVPNLPQVPKTETSYKEKGLLIDVDANALQPGTPVIQWKNQGELGGHFKAGSKAPLIEVIGGKKAVVFNGTQMLESSFGVLASLTGNSSYTVAYWVYLKQVQDEAPVLTWAFGGRDLNNAIFGFGKQRALGAVQHGGFSDMPYREGLPRAAKWHHVVVTFDGVFEKIFVDGKPNNQENKMLFIQAAKSFLIGAKNNRQASFTGAIAELKVYDHALNETDINKLYNQPPATDISIYLDASKLGYGKLLNWINEGATGGGFKAASQLPMVKDVAGKIAVSFTGNEALLFNTSLPAEIVDNSNYSVAVSVFKEEEQPTQPLMKWTTGSNGQVLAGKEIKEGKWYYVIKTFDKKNVKEYIDGKLVRTTAAEIGSTSNQFLIGAGDDKTKGFGGAISHLVVYKHTLSEEEITTLTDNWSNNLHIATPTLLSFNRTPKAVSPNMVMMEADPGTAPGNLSYYFSRQDNPTGGEWLESPSFIDYTVSADKEYQYTFKIKDHYGNVTTSAAPVTVTTYMKNFNVRLADFSNVTNYLLEGPGTFWSGLVGKAEKESAKSIATSNGVLTIESKGTNWDGNTPFGPFIYKEVTGDFVAEVMVPDVSGLAAKKVTGNNEAGLMIRLPQEAAAVSRRPQQILIQNGIFPAWNVGNLFTNFQNGRREQNNIQTAWNYNKYLQVQRLGNVFFVRTSKDGINWMDMPGSPVTRTDMDGKTVQVGLYQATYGTAEAYGAFSNFKLIQLK